MSISEKTIEKIRNLPESLVQEVNNFIEFILLKNNPDKSACWQYLQEITSITESDFSDYLSNLEDYEERLALSSEKEIKS